MEQLTNTNEQIIKDKRDYYLFYWNNIKYWIHDKEKKNGCLYDYKENKNEEPTISDYGVVGIVVNGIPNFINYSLFHGKELIY
jgi:hypothetical protein